MSRIIKFRGWHTKQQKMYSAEEMAKDQLTLLTTGEFINVHGSSQQLSTIYPANKFIPLQFTGLHDRNGKEIYEGDIISIPSAQVRDFMDDIPTKRIVKWDAEDCQFTFYYLNHKKQTSGWMFREKILSQSEVIGNIYQNQELTEV